MIHTDARYFTPSPDEEEESESEDEEDEDKEEKEEINQIIDGKTLFETRKRQDFTGVLSPPPSRVLSAGPDSSVDPWSAGVDPWTCASMASSSSEFAERYRIAAAPTDSQSFVDRYRSPSAPTPSAAVTKALF